MIEELRRKLVDFIEYKKGVAIRAFIHEYQMKHYKRKYSLRERYDFMDRHTVSLEQNHPQSGNHPYYYTMFTEITQHIQGDTIAELLDIAIDIEKGLINE